MKLILILCSLVLTGCVTRPSNNPVEETVRKTGGSVYKTVEGEGYRWIDKTVVGAVREVLP